MTIGIDCWATVQRPLQVRKFCWNATARPISNPPKNVNGRFFSRPMMAAANASMMSRVRVCTSSDASSSARKMPAMAARPEPSAHENIETRPGLTPFRPASDAVVDDGPHGDAEARA